VGLIHFRYPNEGYGSSSCIGARSMNRPRLSLADDHRIVVEGLRRIHVPEYDLVGIVEDGR